MTLGRGELSAIEDRIAARGAPLAGRDRLLGVEVEGVRVIDGNRPLDSAFFDLRLPGPVEGLAYLPGGPTSVSQDPWGRLMRFRRTLDDWYTWTGFQPPGPNDD